MTRSSRVPAGLFSELDIAIAQRNPVLASLLLPGLTSSKVEKKLRLAKISGQTEPIIATYQWHSGTQGKPCISMEEVSLFPSNAYCLSSLDMMIAYFTSFPEMVAHDVRYEAVVGRYFPLFWNGSTDFIVIDLTSDSQRVCLLEQTSKNLIRHAYSRFDIFLKDAVEANREKRSLVCFQ